MYQARSLSLLLAAALVGGPALAGSAVSQGPASRNPVCSAFDGTTPTFDSLDTFLAAATVSKNRFESDTAFHARAKAAANKGKRFLLLRSQSDRKEITYDPENEMAIFYLEDFGLARNEGRISFDESLRGAGLDDEDSYALVRSDTQVGTYAAHNAFGASVRVRKIARREVFFLDQSGIENTKPWGISYKSAEARSLLPRMKPAILVDVSDGMAFYEQSTAGATFDDPRSLAIRRSLFTGKAVCFFMYLPGAKIVATFDPSDRFD